MVNQQNYDKIMRGNFSGMNLTDIKITLAGEILMHENAIREMLEQKSKDNLQDLYDKINKLKEIQKKVSARIQEELLLEKSKSHAKMGAKLKKKDDLQEWLDKQEALRKNPMMEGSDVFTYRTHNANKNIGQLESEFAQNKQLIDAITRMRQKVQPIGEVSGSHTGPSSVDSLSKWSFFEKIEQLKSKVLQKH